MQEHYKITMPCLFKILKGGFVPCIIEVNSKSRALYRNTVEQCARYFLREGYSEFLHYCSGHEKDSDCIAFLFVDWPHWQVIGACCFRFREFRDIPEKFWTMHWIWIHPYQRNKGILSRHIPFFNERFGYWYPEMPHSKAMAAFVVKNGLVPPKKHFQNIPQQL